MKKNECNYSMIVFKVLLIMGWVFCSYLLLAENGGHAKAREMKKALDSLNGQYFKKVDELNECKQQHYDQVKLTRGWMASSNDATNRVHILERWLDKCEKKLTPTPPAEGEE